MMTKAQLLNEAQGAVDSAERQARIARTAQGLLKAFLQNGACRITIGKGERRIAAGDWPGCTTSQVLSNAWAAIQRAAVDSHTTPRSTMPGYRPNAKAVSA